jgi:hypothetical protein
MSTGWKSNRMVFIVLLGICGMTMLVASDKANAEEWPLAGNWIVTVPTPAGNVILVQSILPQDSSGTRFTSIMRQARENYTFFGIFPESEGATSYVGQVEKTGENTFAATFQKYATRKGDGPVADIVFIEVTSMEGRLIDKDTMEGDATVAIFMPEQDADGDGFPDPGEQPVIVQAFSAKAKRQKLMPAYELTPAPMPFCEYGTGLALKLGAGQAIWDQVWGAAAPSWYKCTAAVNAQFLGENVVGLLETADAGPSAVDGNLIVRFTYGGKITLNKLAAPGSTEVTGRIVGEMEGICIADLNAERATFDEQGNIVIVMGGPTLHNEPDVKIKVIEKTGVFANIKQVGTWRLYMTAKVTIARDPSLDLQKNIMAGLGDPKLLVGAAEEFVLSGWYYRQ